jgi:xanthine dehydrogenase molybdopterin-binding subunit B
MIAPNSGVQFGCPYPYNVSLILYTQLELTTLMQVNLNSQYFFYMETQTALAIPDEDNCMVVYSSSQCPETAQNVIAKCLGLPCHNVRVITRRVGGGFGGKAVRSLPVSVNSYLFVAICHAYDAGNKDFICYSVFCVIMK